MTGLPELTAALIVVGLVVYVLTGGADFGGGVWDLLASGPRADAQRKVIERAIAPVWEANHIWLIFVVVVLFSAFPVAYAVICIALHVPLTLMLLGIVFRGSAFVFRHYGATEETSQRRWGRVFAISSAVTPIFLGVIVGAVTSGEIKAPEGLPTGGFFAPWLKVFPFAVGLLTLAMFAFLAAVYLIRETDDPALQDDFRKRALGAAAALFGAALLAGSTAGPGTQDFQRAFFHSPWTWPLQLATGALAVSAIACLIRRRYQGARILAASQIAAIVIGWALAQHPYLVAPDVTIGSAAAPAITLKILLVTTALGMVVLAPSLYWLMRVFKGARDEALPED